MEKIIQIGDKEVYLKSTASAPLRYKTQFKRDFFADVLDNIGKDLSEIDLGVIYNIAWVYAKTADPTTPPPKQWLDTFNILHTLEALQELKDFINSTLNTTNHKQINRSTGGELLTVDSYVFELKAIGISLEELEFFDIGGILDLRTEYIYQRQDNKDEKEVEATQEDIDKF